MKNIDMMKLAEGFWELLRESVIIQALMSLTVTAVIAYMTVTMRSDGLSKEFWLIAGAIYGFYFRTKNDNEVRTLVKEVTKVQSST